MSTRPAQLVTTMGASTLPVRFSRRKNSRPPPSTQMDSPGATSVTVPSTVRVSGPMTWSQAHWARAVESQRRIVKVTAVAAAAVRAG
jgi:type IV secretory pathway TrbL component